MIHYICKAGIDSYNLKEERHGCEESKILAIDY